MPTVKTQLAYDRIALAAAESLIDELETAVEAAEEAIGDIEDALPPTGTRTVTTTGNITASDVNILADASGGAITLTLPDPALVSHQIRITKIDGTANVVTIDGDGTDTVNGNPDYDLPTQYSTAMLTSDTVNAWYAT